MQVKNIIVLLVVILILFGDAQARNGSIIKEITFPAYTLKIENINNYDLIRIKGCDLTIQEPGKPVIPVANLNVLIPPSAEITSIEILDAKQIEIPGKYILYPGQNPYPLSYQGEKPFVAPDAETYQLTTAYPGYLTQIIPSGNKSGFRIGGFFLYPLQYIPSEGKLILNERMTVKINYEENRYEVWSLTQSQKNLFQSDVKDLVINPEDIEKFSPLIKASDPTNIDYVILTSSSLESRFTPLVNWLKKTGYKTETRNVTWVNSNYPGRDLQEKIRNFIRDYFTNYGMKYILLAGDHSIIPSRQARAVVGSNVGNIPCDLYYLDLQWSWDGNNNNIFGEATYDTVDLYYDLYGGRWPVETTAELDTLIRKFFTYVKNPNIGYQKRMMLPAAYLWTGYDHTTSQNMIAGYSPADWTDRVIDMGQNDAWRWAVRDSLNTGFGFLHMVGHGNDYGVYISGPMYYYSDPATQTNYDKLTIANSIACYPGNFETNDCLAEMMVLARGSAIATIMNSRYGWGYTNQIGPSELLDVRFYNYFFSYDSIRIANCHQSSKEFYRNTAMSQQVWRWCYYELNLFGEPQMMMWKDNPQTMSASFANPIYTGPQSFTVTVTSGGSPVASAIVALWKGTEVFTKGTTNASGQVTLSINPSSTGYMYITVTAKNKLPIEDSTQVVAANQFDVGVTTLLQPSGTISQNTVVTPACSVYNYGNTNVSFLVRMKIGNFYNQTASVSNLAPGTKQYVTFTNWTATQLGTHPVSCSTELTGDMNPANDKQTGSVTVIYTDVGVTTLLQPSGTISQNTVVTPACSVYNYGNTNVSFLVRMKIG
ncbi:MAG: C25 family cysteine peptidase, partial [candidate division WOR-3 bacterium]|nr:C25 family cysteine peptidase [candidate division WOR-3 bacterium]